MGNKIRWVFVRDMNEELWFLNDGNWVDEMNSGAWKSIAELFE